MIIVGSTFKVCDNTGVLSILSICNLSKKKRDFNVGDILLGIIKSIKINSKFRTSAIVRALIINTKKHYKDKDYCVYNYKYNSVILLDKRNKPLGSRIKDPVYHRCLNSHILKLNTVSKLIF